VRKQILSAHLVFACLIGLTFCSRSSHAQDPAITNYLQGLDQEKMAEGKYPLKEVLEAGGHLWTTPFQPYDGEKGDGYGEGPSGPRSMQRAIFNSLANSASPANRYLRVNGLDSQSCFECHNSIGSYVINSKTGMMIRKPFGVGGPAGSNSNAFINPRYPVPQTLFVRNPPAVFGSGYVQALAAEMTIDLQNKRKMARMQAMNNHVTHEGSAELISKGVDFGLFKTTYHPDDPNRMPEILTGVDPDQLCSIQTTPVKPGEMRTGIDALDIGGAMGFTDDVTDIIKTDSVSCDLVVRPFQWKGIASGLRHFVRDALDFHFSMQAFEKVGLCDCDMDGKPGKAPGIKDAEVSMAEVTAMTAFVAMTRPPIQLPIRSEQEQIGQEIFFGTYDKFKKHPLPANAAAMCATCHIGTLHLIVPKTYIEWPINPNMDLPPSTTPNV
jgi:hypothetical protein